MVLNNDFPTRVYSQSEVTKASVALLMMDGDAATPILNFTDKRGKGKRNIHRKMLILTTTIEIKILEVQQKWKRVTLLIMMKKLGAAVTIATVIMIAPLGLPALRGNSVNLKDLDEAKKDFQKRMGVR